jgi:hypothetical protein
VNDARPLIMDLTETAAIACRSIVALGSLAIPSRLRFGPNDGIPHIIGTGFAVDTRGVVMTAGHVARAELAAEASSDRQARGRGDPVQQNLPESVTDWR